jgi:hypothetical protein
MRVVISNGRIGNIIREDGGRERERTGTRWVWRAGGLLGEER